MSENNSKFETAEKIINEIEYSSIEIIQSEAWRKKKKKGKGGEVEEEE